MTLKVSVCTPVPNEEGPAGTRHGRVCIEWHQARLDLAQPFSTNVVSKLKLGFQVDEARNLCAAEALDDGSKFLFFLDWDVLPHRQTLHQLMQRALNNPDIDVFSGVYCCRHRDYPAPLIYLDDGAGGFDMTWEWSVGDLLVDGIAGVGMGCCLIRTSLFEKMGHSPSNPWFKTDHDAGLTEDLWFLRRARKELGTKIMVDTALLAGHIDPETGVVYHLPYDCLPIKRWRANNPNIPENAIPYDCRSYALMNIGQKVSDCSLTVGAV